MVAAAVVLTVAGCGGGDGKTSATASGSTAASGDTAAFRDCLKEHGVDLPDNFGQGAPGSGAPQGGGTPPSFQSGGPPPGSDSSFQDALNACRDKAPAGFGAGRNSQEFQAYTSCLRDHGVDVPDPSSTGSSSSQLATPPTFDRNDPAFSSASDVCQALLPTTTTTVTP